MTIEHMDSHANRVLALLKRQPNMTVGEIAASLSGIVQHEARKALARLREAGLVERKGGAPNIWFPVVEVQAKDAAPPKSLMGSTDYKPKYTAPARADAFDHLQIGSRRGDVVVPYAPPMGMEGVPIKVAQHPVKPQKVSPIGGSSFCKRTATPAMVVTRK